MRLDGLQARKELTPALRERVQKLDPPPCLSVLEVGADPQSEVYIEKKKEYSEVIGCGFERMSLPQDARTEQVVERIKEIGRDEGRDGLIVQLPLPATVDRDRVIDAIPYEKDADGMTAEHIKKQWRGSEGGVMAATAAGVIALLDFYNVEYLSKKVTVIGRSALVGKPVAWALLNRGSTVTVCHRGTSDLAAVTHSADIVISAAGSPGLIGAGYVSAGQTVIDVGISTVYLENNKRRLKGDVNVAAVEPVVANLSPVPGGVGPMTVYSLFANLVELTEKRRGSKR